MRDASPKHYLLFARVSGAALVMAGWAVAVKIGGLVKIVLIAELFGAVVGVSIFGALVWRRATRAGAIASILVMGPALLLWNGVS